jgi:heme/copper-type cytochrome/quinol oxidase subunit 2
MFELMASQIPSTAVQWWNLFKLFLYVGLAAGIIVVGFMIYFIARAFDHWAIKEALPYPSIANTFWLLGYPLMLI